MYSQMGTRVDSRSRLKGEETASLVQRDAAEDRGRLAYTDGNPFLPAVSGQGGSGDERGDGDKGKEPYICHDEVDFVDTEVSLLSQFHEDAISQAGFGLFQCLLYLVVGLGLAADTIEIFVIAYIIPSAEVELCMTDLRKGWLGSITFIGMMIGGVIWGALGDHLGRRQTLISALTVDAIFSSIAAFMPTYGTFMTCRLCSGIGIGGSLPIVFAYFSEFLARHHRGMHLSWLLMAWALGGLFTALMAWSIVPRTGASVIENEKEHFSSWREFLLVCSIPSFLSVIGLIFMPESPRYLLENRKETQAMEVYQHIFKMNHRGDPTARYTLTEMELPKKSLPPGFHSAASTTGILDTIFDGIDGFWASVLGLFAIQYRKTTQVLMIIWLTSAFGYYGLSLWFPEYMKLLKSEEFYRNQTTIKSKNYLGQQFTGDITNTRYVNCQFMESEFKALILNHVLFDNCSFINVDFKDIHSSKTFFRNSFIQNSHFTDTDFYDFRFQNTNKVNTTNVALMVGCQLDFDFNIQLEEVFHEHLFGQLALIPGTIVSLFLLDKFGRVHVLAGSLFLSSVTAFFIWFLSTKVSVIIFEVIFNFIFIAGWNAVDIATVEYYPAHLRTTGYGLLSAVCRTGAIFGSISFASFIGSSRAVPMLATAAVLLAGAIASLKMTETRDILL